MNQDWADRAATDPGPRSLERASYALYVVNAGGLRIVPLPHAGSIMIGRSEIADVVVINDARVSRGHLRLHCGRNFLVEDLDRLSGTTIDGARLRAGELRTLAPGSAITIGETMLVVLDAGNESAALVDAAPAARMAARRSEITDDAIEPS